MGSICDKCFGSSDNKKSSHSVARQRPKTSRLVSMRQNTISTQQLTEHEYGSYGSQYDASAHRQEEHLPPGVRRPRFGSEESSASGGSRSERFGGGSGAGSCDSSVKTGRVTSSQRRPAMLTRQMSLDNEAPRRKSTRKHKR